MEGATIWLAGSVEPHLRPVANGKGSDAQAYAVSAYRILEGGSKGGGVLKAQEPRGTLGNTREYWGVLSYLPFSH